MDIAALQHQQYVALWIWLSGDNWCYVMLVSPLCGTNTAPQQCRHVQIIETAWTKVQIPTCHIHKFSTFHFMCGTRWPTVSDQSLGFNPTTQWQLLHAGVQEDQLGLRSWQDGCHVITGSDWDSRSGWRNTVCNLAWARPLLKLWPSRFLFKSDFICINILMDVNARESQTNETTALCNVL